MTFWRYTLLILACSLFTFSGSAQKMSFYEADALTYQQYLQQDWKQLIKTGTKALRYGYDSYYLQLRLAAAYYEEKKFFNAARHYQNAYNINPNDDYVAESLYYSYLYSGKFTAAQRLSENFSPTLKKRLSIEPKRTVDALNLDYQITKPSDYSMSKSVSEGLTQTVSSGSQYMNIGLLHRGENGSAFYHAFSRVSLQNHISNASNPDLPAVFDEQVRQNQYYTQYSLHTKQRWNLTLAAHYLNSRFYGTSEQNSMPGPGWQANNILYDNFTHTLSGSFGAGKQFGNFYLAAESSLIGINGGLQFQPGTKVYWFPIGNRSLSLRTEIVFPYTYNRFEQNEFSTVLKPEIAIYIGKHIYLSSFVNIGKMQNYTEFNTLIIDIHPDPVNQRYGALLNINNTNEKFNFYLKYKYELRENQYLLSFENQYIKYNNQSITGGILWYF